MKKNTLSLLTFVALFGVATGCASTARTAEGKGGSKGGTATRSAQVRSGEGGTAQLSSPVGAGQRCTLHSPSRGGSCVRNWFAIPRGRAHGAR